MDKWFLLVFHGGLVGYLLLHNLAIPLVQNWGQDATPWRGLQYYFFPQALLFAWFVKYGLSKKKAGLLPFLCGLNLSLWALSSILFVLDLRGGISTHQFTNGISLVAICCFFVGFFSYFQKFFHWRFPGTGAQYALAACLGSALAVLHHQQLKIPHDATASFPRSTAEAKSEILLELSLPAQNFDSPEIVIEANGFARKMSLLPEAQESPLALLNRSPEKHLIRLEHARQGRWYFKRIINLKAGESTPLPPLPKGFYRLRAPSSKNLGAHILVRGSESFAKGIYMFDNKGIEVR